MGNRKRRKRGIVILVMLLALGGIFLLYRLVGKMEDPLKEPGNQMGSGTTTYTISDLLYTDIRELRYTCKEETFTFNYDSEKALWSYREEPNFPLRGEFLDNMAAYISSLTSTRKLDRDTGEYGFDNPTLEVSAVYVDGTRTSYKVGSYNSFADGYYLLTENGSVYLVSETIVSCFGYHLNDMILLDSVPEDFNENELTAVILKGKDGNESMITDADDILELADASVDAISMDEWACAFASPEEKSSLYGISANAQCVTLVYLSYYSASEEVSPVLTERSWTYCFGNTFTEEETEKIYFALSQDGESVSGIVYQTDLSIYEKILTVVADKA